MRLFYFAGLACVLMTFVLVAQYGLLAVGTSTTAVGGVSAGKASSTILSRKVESWGTGLKYRLRLPPEGRPDTKEAGKVGKPLPKCATWDCEDVSAPHVIDTTVQGPRDASLAVHPPKSQPAKGKEGAQLGGGGGKEQPPREGKGDKGAKKPYYQKAATGAATSHSKHAPRDYFCENRASAAELAQVDTSSMTSYIATGGRFPILLVTKDRVEQLANTLKSLLAVRGVTKEDIFVVQDGENGGIASILAEYGVRSHVNTAGAGWGGDGAAKIAMNYGYSLGQAFTEHPKAPGVIVVEDDFTFSPDFYEYFHAVAPALEADPTMWLASAWHDNGFDYLVADPYALRRTRYFPGLGWLLPRKVWSGELAHKWPQTHWDHWMRDPAQHKGRDIIIPEIPRDYHMGIKGTFMDSGTHNRYFGSIAMQADPAFTWDTPTGAAAIEDLLRTRYEARVRDLITDKDTVHLSSVADIGKFSEGQGVVWYSVPPGEPNHDHMRAVAGYFGIWHEGGRASRDGIHELWWLGTSRLVLVNAYSGPVGMNNAHVTGSIEVSSLRSLLPKGQKVLDWNDFLNAERPQLPTHANLFGALLRSPLAHIDGGFDANGAPDSGAAGHAGGTVVVYTRSSEADGEQGGEGHEHSAFMGDLRLSRGADTPEAQDSSEGGGASKPLRVAAGQASRIGVLPENVHVVPASLPGLSCTDICAAYVVKANEAAAAAVAGGHKHLAEAESEPGDWRCAAAYFPVINDCDTLRNNYQCSRCIDSMGPDQPAFIDPSAPHDKAPSACLVNTDASMFTCEGRWSYARRLCPCELFMHEH